jgi:hypothetical protein
MEQRTKVLWVAYFAGLLLLPTVLAISAAIEVRSQPRFWSSIPGDSFVVVAWLLCLMSVVAMRLSVSRRIVLAIVALIGVPVSGLIIAFILLLLRGFSEIQ